MIVKMSDHKQQMIVNIGRTSQGASKKGGGELVQTPKWYMGRHKEKIKRNVGLGTIKEAHTT